MLETLPVGPVPRHRVEETAVALGEGRICAVTAFEMCVGGGLRLCSQSF